MLVTSITSESPSSLARAQEIFSIAFAVSILCFVLLSCQEHFRHFIEFYDVLSCIEHQIRSRYKEIHVPGSFDTRKQISRIVHNSIEIQDNHTDIEEN